MDFFLGVQLHFTIDQIFSFELVNYKKPSLCRAFSKFPSLGRQREGQKINPLEKFFCFGSKLEPFSYAGLLLAPKWSHFSSMASKLMPCPFRISSVWLQNWCHKNKHLPLFRSRRSFLVFSFYRSSRISSSLISSVGLPLATSLFRKDNRAIVSSRRSPAQSANTRFLLYLNITTPQQ